MDEKTSQETDICSQISRALMKDGNIAKVEYCGHIEGGIINKAGLFKIDGRETFVKFATRDNAFSMFSSERESLLLTENTQTIRVPHPGPVYTLPECGGACLLLEYLPDLSPVTTQWTALGEHLARLHKYNTDLVRSAYTTSSVHKPLQKPPVTQFGFNHPVHIGPSEVVPPAWEDDWLTYFSNFSLKARFDEIERKTGDAEFREIWSELQLLFHKPFSELEVLPSIIHGDFCTINVGEWQGQPVLFDPGCYYGHSEVDFIIPTMEDNFPPEFYEAYFKLLPKNARGFSERQALYVFGAWCMLYMVKGNESFRQTTIDHGHNLLKLLRQYT